MNAQSGEARGQATAIFWLKMASLYFLAGVILGTFMAATENFRYMPVHAHINLLGWVSMALFGLLYHRFPHLAVTRLARIHLWLYALAVPYMLVMLVLLLDGHTGVGPAIGIGAVAVVLSVLLLVINLFRGLRPA